LLSFVAAKSYPAGPYPYAVAVGDFNADGKPDLVTANSTADTVSVLIGNGDGSFQAPVAYAVGRFPKAVAVGDFNGDGKADVVAANSYESSVSVLLGKGNGGLIAARHYVVPGLSPHSVAIGEFKRGWPT
jgi:hypothetical protein